LHFVEIRRVFIDAAQLSTVAAAKRLAGGGAALNVNSSLQVVSVKPFFGGPLRRNTQ
jgi:hypothetical protein